MRLHERSEMLLYMNEEEKARTYWSPKSSNGGSKRTRLAATLKYTQQTKTHMFTVQWFWVATVLDRQNWCNDAVQIAPA